MTKYDRDPWHDTETIPLWLFVVIALALLILALFLTGCCKTVARVEDGVMTITRTRFFIKEDIGSVSYDAADGSFIIEGYKSNMTRALELVKYFANLADEYKKERR